jgi:hypothetical protein
MTKETGMTGKSGVSLDKISVDKISVHESVFCHPHGQSAQAKPCFLTNHQTETGTNREK